MWSLLARLPYRWAVVAWSAILGLAVVGLVAATLLIARLPCDPWCVTVVAGIVLASAPVRNSLALGQAALLSAACVALTIPAYRARRALGACGATLLAAVQPNLALPLVAQVRSRWDWCVAGAAALPFAALTAVCGGGLAGFWAYLRHLVQHGRAERTITIAHTPVAIAWAFGAPEPAALLVGAVIALVTLGITLATAVRERLDAATATVLACAIVPLAMPFFHEQDFAITVLPLGVLLTRARGEARTGAAVAAVLLLVDWLSFAQRPQAAVQTLCLGFALVALIAAANPAGGRERRSDLAALAVLCALAAVALPLGRSHQAPTWPENLPAGYRSAAGDDISAVWADEAHATGLDHREPVWGLLRCLPLLGCVLLAWSTMRDARRSSPLLATGPKALRAAGTNPAPVPRDPLLRYRTLTRRKSSDVGRCANRQMRTLAQIIKYRR